MEEDVADHVSGLYGHSDATELDSESLPACNQIEPHPQKY